MRVEESFACYYKIANTKMGKTSEKKRIPTEKEVCTVNTAVV